MSHGSSIRVERYEPKHKNCWDDLVRRSKNGVFLFYRDYMEYHIDRFIDASLLFFEDDRLVALLPANQIDDTVVSHGGLTFGGVVCDALMTTYRMLGIFSALIDHLRAQGIKKLIYKPIPRMYHTLPAEEDLYALFLSNARLFLRDVSSVIARGQNAPSAEVRQMSLQKSKSFGIEVAQTSDFSEFMSIVAAGLKSRYGVLPVHTAAEMELLAGRFPENIKLFTARRGGKLLAGVVVYENSTVAHAQYISTTSKGRALGALDAVFDALLHEIYRDKPCFDFGKSTAGNGRSLNLGLIRNKESYGARATVYDFYELDL
jgi:hypothetical protein